MADGNKAEKLLCKGMEITKLLRRGGLKPVTVNTGKSPLARATRLLTQANCLIILSRIINQNTAAPTTQTSQLQSGGKRY